MGKTYLGTVFLTLLATSSMGADHDVMQVKSPFVVKHPLGPLMEVHRRQPLSASSSFRESRNADFPAYGRECYSCSTGTYGSSDWSSSSSSSSHSSGGSYVPGAVGYPTYGAPQSTSSRQEFRSEQKFVNGQPVYDLHHERKFEDGQLVHEERREKDEDDFGVPRASGMSSGSTFDWGTQPGFSKRTEEVRRENRTYGSHGYGSGYSTGSFGSDGFSSSFDAEIAKLREDLHRQTGTYRSQPLLPTRGSTHRTEFHTKTRYVNGQPVYVKKEERKYADGRLVHNSTEEKDADDLGTSDLQQHYETAHALAGEPQSGYYERRHQYHESYGSSNPWYPTSSSHGSYHPSSSSSSSSSQSAHSSYRPTYGGSAQSTHGTYSRESGTSSPYRPSAPDSRTPSSAYSPYRPHSSTSTYSRQESHESGASSSYQPSRESSVYYRQDSGDSSSYPTGSSAYTPGHRISYGTYSGRSHESASPSYPSQRPVSGSSVRTSDESYRTSSSYSGHRPSEGSSVTQTSGSSVRTSPYRPSSGSHSSYPSYSPSEDRSSSRSYSEERLSSSTHSSGGTYADRSESADDLDERYLLQSAVDSSLDGDDAYETHVNLNAITSDSSREPDHPYRPRAPDSSYSQSRSHSVSSETHYGSHSGGASDLSSSTTRTGGGARTVAIDLSSSSLTGVPSSGHTSYTQDSQVTSEHREHSPTYGRGTYSSEREEHVSSHSTEEHSRTAGTSSSTGHREVGIPGVISGPYTGHGEGDHYDKERYDISPLDDELPQLPPVENEIDTSSFPAPPPPAESEIDSSDLYDVHSDKSDDQDHDEHDGSGSPYPDYGTGGSPSRTSDATSGYSHSAYLYNRTHTIYGIPVAQSGSSTGHAHRDYSHSSTVDESQRVYPATSGSHHYRYNETRRHSTIIGGQQPAVVSGSSLTSECTQTSGCIPGSSHASSRRSEIRTSKRYINGDLVGITHYERIYENGNLVHENVTEQGVDELTPAELQKYGIDQLNLAQGSYEPGSYSQRHEVKQEKKFVNGQQTYGLHHERRFEDGQLVHENRTEKDEDDFGISGGDGAYLGTGYTGGYSDTAGRHEVRQSQHMQQHVTSESQPGIIGHSSETRQVADTSRVITNPVYTTRRHETRRQQEYIDGQPVYDLHHERRYQDGSLVYENRTELDEKESRGSAGYRDALHEMMSGSGIRTVTESSHGRSSGASGSGTYDTHYGGSYGGSASSSSSSLHTDESYEGSSSRTHEISDASLGSSLLTGGSPLSHSGGATTTIFGSSSHGSSGSSLGSSMLTGGSSSGYSGEASTSVIGASSHESSGSSLGSSLLTGSSSSGHSGGATTTIFGTSHGPSGSSSHGSSGSSSSSSILTEGSSLSHSGGATTTVFGGSPSHESSGRESSSRHYESSYEASQSGSTGGSGCLTCVLMGGGSGYSSHGSSSSHESSHGYSSGGYSTSYGTDGGSDGFSQRREMSREEYYEDGQLVRGREEDKSFRDGQLVQQNRRVYSGAPGQIAGAEALQSARTSYVSSSSSRSSSSSSHGSGTGYGARVTVKGDTTGVCDPNPCMNGSTCIAGLRGPLCVCPFGFKGTKCEEAYCPKRFCRYGGTCSVVGGIHECDCKRGYSGARCLERKTPDA